MRERWNDIDPRFHGDDKSDGGLASAKTQDDLSVKKILTPTVSVIIPMYNEEGYIEKCLRSLIEQDYDQGKYNIIVVDGRSTDNSVSIVRKFLKPNKIILLNNNAKIASAGINIGIRHTNADIIIILGAHSFIPSDFIKKNVNFLDVTGADCVGGKIDTIGEGYFGKAISLAMGCYFGAGSPKFRCGSKEGYTDTVAFGAYKRRVFEEIGVFDEALLRGMDAEFNYRLRHNKKKIFFTPSIRVFYYNRINLLKLWIQYFRCGYWKVEIARRYPDSMQYRQFVPFIFILGILATGVLAFFDITFPAVFLFATYSSLAVAFTIKEALRHGLKYTVFLPVIFLIIHTAYGIGFLLGLRHLLNTKEEYSIA